MKIQQLMEGSTPKLPGAFKGVQVMTPQQFLAKAGDETEQEVSEGIGNKVPSFSQYIFSKLPRGVFWDLSEVEDLFDYAYLSDLGIDNIADEVEETGESAKKVATGRVQWVLRNMDKANRKYLPMIKPLAIEWINLVAKSLQGVAEGNILYGEEPVSWEHGGTRVTPAFRNPAIDLDSMAMSVATKLTTGKNLEKLRGMAHDSTVYRALDRYFEKHTIPETIYNRVASIVFKRINQQGVAEGLNEMDKSVPQPKKKASDDHLSRIRQLSGLDEATKLPAQSREFGGQEFQDYMKRIVGTPDLDKAGKPKVDKKGIEKYVSGKTKGDKYKMPYIHRSSVVEYLGPDGQTYDEDKVKQTLAIRPKSLLKQNEKMKHSNGELEQFFNVGFAALTGIALDEQTNNLIIVNTCPGAGSCKVDCFAMKGGKIQFKAAWQSDGRILTYLLNEPDQFFNQLSAEISKEEKLGDKGGYEVTIRWHDAGDFFSPEYLDMALKMAEKHPGVKFYAYTKMADATLAKKPANFIINWSEGAHTSQEKQVKAQDPTLAHTKNSRIVPTDLFGDLLAKDAKGNLAKGPEGQWVIVPDKLPELKQRIAKQYGLSANSILGYDEWDAKTNGGKRETPIKYNVIIAPGEPDITANTPGVLSTLLLRH